VYSSKCRLGKSHASAPLLAPGKLVPQIGKCALDAPIAQSRFAGGAGTGRPSIAFDPDQGGRGSVGARRALRRDLRRGWVLVDPPERLPRALLLQMLSSVRSERMLIEQLETTCCSAWFVGMMANESVWHATVFTKNPDPVAGGRGGRGVSSP
jgi:hypothetical protein